MKCLIIKIEDITCFNISERANFIMIENRIETQGIKTSAILKEAIKLYKENYKLFLKITFITFLFQVFSGTINLF